MKSKVRLSTYSLVTTLIAVLVIGWCCVITFGRGNGFYVVAAIFLIFLVSAALYAPLSVETGEHDVTVRSALKKHRIPLSEIEEVQLFQPTMGTYRLFGSGGFMGYWGIFREGDVGKYTAFYGKASDCFLIRMKDGRKYVLGCEKPENMVENIKQKIG